MRGEDIGPNSVATIHHGDTLRVGNTTFEVFLLDEAEVERLWPGKSSGT